MKSVALILTILELYLRTKLHRARITNRSDPAKVRSAGGVVQAGESSEVCMVENVEDFRPQLQSS